MKSRARSTYCRILFIFMLAGLSACASTEVTRQTPIINEGIARPNQIWIYDFVAEPVGDTSSESMIHNRGSETDEQIQTGRRLGTLIASDLVSDIQAMGFPTAQAADRSSPQVGDAEVLGQVILIEDGGLAKRFIVGFGAGASRMDTVAEAYMVTQHGLLQLGSWTLSSSGSRGPGIIVPTLTAIALANPLHLAFSGGMKLYGELSGRSKLEGRARATADTLANELRTTFQERGWIL